MKAFDIASLSKAQVDFSGHDAVNSPTREKETFQETALFMPISRLRLTAALSILVLASACGRGANANHSAANATPTTPSTARGALLFAANCAACHGNRGRAGRIGPQLRDERKRKSAEAIRAIITDPDPPMPKLYPGQLTSQDVDDLTAYVETL